VSELQPAYLVSGDDDVKIDAWRARLKARAEAEGGQGSLESYDAAAMPPDAAAAELAAMTFSTGTRYILVDGVESWKAPSLDPLEHALENMPPETVLVLIARGKAPARLANAVGAAGGKVVDYDAPKAKELAGWVVAQARDHGLQLRPDAARTLVAVVGERQQRLAREVERLALLAYPDTELNVEQVARLAAGEASTQAYELADAVVAGDVAAALRSAEQLREMGEAPGRLLYSVVRRLRDVHKAAELLDSGVPEPEVAGQMGMPPWLAKRMVATARRTGRDALARAICVFADLEVELRGGADEQLDEYTAFSLTLARSAG
jgi:DNA polymerase-3 subunit delta